MAKNSEKVQEGYMPFLGYQTYYRIVGEQLDPSKKPVIMLHGGPGGTHNYFETLDPLADDGRQLIMYDQLGCGNSFVDGNEDLWCTATWIVELIMLRRHLGIKECHLLGQSWGGMQEIQYYCDCKPAGIKSMVISSGLPSTALWAEEQHRMLKFLPQDQIDAVLEAERTGDYTSEGYQTALANYMDQHGGARRVPTAPECVTRDYVWGALSYQMTQGENEFGATGNFVGWEYRDKLHLIDVPCLITSGTDDLCTPLVAKTMLDGIPDAQWHLFANQRHSAYVEANEEYRAIVGKWLSDHD